MRKLIRLAVPLAVAVLLTAACSSDGDSSGDDPAGDSTGVSATEDSTGSSDVEALISEAQAIVDEAMQKPEVPPLEPVEVVPDKKIGYVVCGFNAPACVLMGEVAEEAIEAAGYEAVLCDGKVSPQGWADCDLQLINEGVDAIINNIGSDALVGSAVKDAREAGIPVLCQLCYNEGSPVENAEEVGSVANVDSDWYGQGVILANFMIVEAEGDPKAGLMQQSVSQNIVARMAGISETLEEKCGDAGCETYEQELQTGDDNGFAGARDLANTFLQQYPEGELDFIVPPSDVQGVAIQQTLATSGRTDVTVAAWDCLDTNLDFIREGVYQRADVATSIVHSSWAIVDQAIRVLAGEEGQDVILPDQLITTENVPEGDACEDSADFADAYLEAWGK